MEDQHSSNYMGHLHNAFLKILDLVIEIYNNGGDETLDIPSSTESTPMPDMPWHVIVVVYYYNKI